MVQEAGVSLGPIEEADLSQLKAWINDRETVIQSTSYQPVSGAQHEGWYSSLAGRQDMVAFAIRAGESSDLVGTCKLSGIQGIHRSAELAIRIGDVARRGEGIGTAAVRLLLHHAFADLNLNRVFLHVFSGNAAALRTYEKAGFVSEGLLREAVFIDGAYLDVQVMSVLRSEWKCL